MFSRLCLAVLVGLGARASALPTITEERLFRLEVDGRVSFLLATASENFPAERRLPPVEQALRQSCALWLEGDVRREDLADEAVYGRHLIELLTTEQLQTYLTLVGFHVPYHSLSPNHATILAREKFAEARGRVLNRFVEYLNTLEVPEQSSLLHYASLNPYLRESVRILFGNDLPIAYLKNRMSTLNAADELAEIKSMPELLTDEAVRLGLPIVRLATPEGASVTEVQLASFTSLNLRKTLDQMRPILEAAHGYSLYQNMSLAYLISWELSQRYFRQNAADYGRVGDLLAKSLLSAKKIFDGDDRVATHESNLHRFWVKRIVRAVRRGGVFIALPIGRVIPGVDGRVKRTIIQELNHQGVRITPLSAERVTLRSVK